MFQCSSQGLQIETESNIDLLRENRFCNLCAMREIETEEHFLMNAHLLASIGLIMGYISICDVYTQ